MRNLLTGITIVVVLLMLIYTYQVLENNKTVETLKPVQLQTTLERSIDWLDQKRDEILAIRNPFLWHMVQKAAEITGDQRLRSLFDAYKKRFLEKRYNNIWRPLFDPKSWLPVHFEDIAQLDDYQQYFVYAMLCDKDLGEIPHIKAQNDLAFCDQHPLRPACATHQLMGIELLERSNCGDMKQVDETVQKLQRRIRRQLILDPRVVDVYMQRVLMLVETGARELIKPIWIKALVDAQQSDGGWTGFEPLIPLVNGFYYGYGQKLFAVKKLPRSNFHMTAQGVLLFSMLSSPKVTISTQ